MKWRTYLPIVLATISLGWCVCAGLRIWFTPMTYSGIGGDGVALIRSEAFSDGSPLRVVALFIPVLVAAVATCAAWQHAPAIVAIAGCLLAAVSFIGGFSIGGAYAPAAAIVLGAAGLSAFLEKPATSALEDTTNDGTS